MASLDHYQDFLLYDLPNVISMFHLQRLEEIDMSDEQRKLCQMLEWTPSYITSREIQVIGKKLYFRITSIVERETPGNFLTYNIKAFI